ncbi:hypothetical protein MPER_01477, partial [Moniliophthora perniciosa FA553]
TPLGEENESKEASSSEEKEEKEDASLEGAEDEGSTPPSSSSSSEAIGFYKAVVVRNPQVVAAIKDMMKRGQPYLGAFLLKDEDTDSDVITDIDSVHPVGVFAQITSVFAAQGQEDKEEGLTAVLYPHRRIKITELVKAGGQAKVETIEAEEPQTVTPPPSPTPEAPKSTGPPQTSFLHNHAISIARVKT